jgi:hypothetical protein
MMRTKIEEYLARNPRVDASRMSRTEAEKLYHDVVTNNPDAQAYIKKMIESNARMKTLYPMWEDGQ